MSFGSTDPIESQMGVMCQDMTPEELVCYVKTYHQAFGVDLAVDGQMERAIFKGLQRIYGPKTAGLIVKWAFYKHKGRHQGAPIVFTSFTKGRKWFCDLMHVEMQDYMRKEKPDSPSRVGVGAKRLSDL